MTICFLEFDEVLSRLFRSGWDKQIQRSILDQSGLKPTEVKAQVVEYERTRSRGQRQEMLADASKELESRGFPIYRKHDWTEILAQHIYDNVNPKWFNIIFGHVNREAEIYPILRRHLTRQEGLDVYDTSSQKRERWPDLYAVKRDRLRRVRSFSIDGKVNYSEFTRFLEQCTTFASYSNGVFVATTPGMVAHVGMRQASGIAHGERAFIAMLEKVGAGAYVADMTNSTLSKILDCSDSQSLIEEERGRRLRIIGWE